MPQASPCGFQIDIAEYQLGGGSPAQIMEPNTGQISPSCRWLPDAASVVRVRPVPTIGCGEDQEIGIGARQAHASEVPRQNVY